MRSVTPTLYIHLPDFRFNTTTSPGPRTPRPGPVHIPHSAAVLGLTRKELRRDLHHRFPDEHDHAIIDGLSLDDLRSVWDDEDRYKQRHKWRRVPRRELEDDLNARLAPEADQGRGAVLVTGYRGVGKTSLVHTVIQRLKRRTLVQEGGAPAERPGRERFIDVHLNLAQDDLDERAILRLMAVELHRALLRLRLDGWYAHAMRFHLRPLIAGLSVLVVMLLFTGSVHWQGLWELIGSPEGGRARTVGAGVALFAVPLLAALYGYRLEHQRVERPEERVLLGPVRRRLEQLIRRMHAHISTDTNAEVDLPFPLKVKHTQKEERGKAEPKEIELEITDILERIGRFEPRTHVLFVIDELDKLMASGDPAVSERDAEDPTDDLPIAGTTTMGHENDAVRRRREAIGSLLANLKHFLGSARAKFIFIGGRELYDATLADVSNRDPFFGSIFSHVVHVPSFLKQALPTPDGEVTGMTVGTEQFIARAILERDPGMADAGLGPVLEQWCHQRPRATKEDQRDIAYAYGALQELVNHLAFRSNGVPKRLVQLFERMVVRTSEHDLCTTVAANEPDLIPFPPIAPAHARTEPAFYLRITPTVRYASTLLTSIYRPYLAMYARYYGGLNDKQLVALTYLMDHLLKFHLNSFSHLNLELAPETIAVNKVPELRKFISDLIGRLMGHHLRTVGNGLFDLRFRSRTYNELAYLTKVSEADAAALNFTLDESLPVKRLYYRRLYHLLGREKATGDGTQAVRVLERIPDLHTWLGDLHFLDTEYEEALAQFRAAARYYAPVGQDENDDRHTLARAVLGIKGPDLEWREVRSTGNGSSKSIQPHFALERFHEYIKLTLRQVHCLERMKALDDAMVLAGALSRSVVDYVWRNSGGNIAARSNWKLVLTALTAKIALVQKMGRYGVRKVDLKDLRDVHRLNGPPSLPHLWALAQNNFQVGLILHYGGQDVRDVDRAPKDLVYRGYLRVGHSALETYAKALIAGLGMRRPLVGLPALFREYGKAIQGVPLNGPHFELLANAMGKFSDALLARISGMDKSSPQWIRALRLPPFPDPPFVAYPELQRLPEWGPYFRTLLLAAHVPEGRAANDTNLFQHIKLLQVLDQAGLTKTEYAAVHTEVRDLKDRALEMVRNMSQRSSAPAMRAWQEHVDDMRHRWTTPCPYAADFRTKEAIAPSLSAVRSEEVEVNALWYMWRLRHEPVAILRQDPGFVAFMDGVDLMTTNQQARVRVLLLVLRHNWMQLLICYALGKGATIEDIKKNRPQPGGMSSLEPLVRNSLHTAAELIHIVERMGIGILFNHTLLATAYHRLGDWCWILKDMAGTTRERITKDLQRSFGARMRMRLTPAMHYAIAKDHYHKAVEAHRRGPAYRRAMEDMYMVEDDYNDNLYHFSCAFERMQIARSMDFDAALKRIDRILKELD